MSGNTQRAQCSAVRARACGLDWTPFRDALGRYHSRPLQVILPTHPRVLRDSDQLLEVVGG